MSRTDQVIGKYVDELVKVGLDQIRRRFALLLETEPLKWAGGNGSAGAEGRSRSGRAGE